MRFVARVGVMLLFLLGTVKVVTAAPTASSSADLAMARQHYEDAVQLIDRGFWTEYKRLRPALDAYPLAIYLDYFQLVRQSNTVSTQDVRNFIARSGDSPLPNRLLSVYLPRLGQHQRWREFLEVKPDEPNAVVLKCYYFRAQLAEGNRDAAWAGAARLWVHGKSQPKQCDPLFEAWQRAGQLNDALVWTRLRNNFTAKQGALMRYVAQKGSDQLRPWSDSLQSVYARPDGLPNKTLPRGNAYALDIAKLGLTRLAQYNPEEALQQWQDFRQRLAFTDQQVQQVEYAIARNSLLGRTAAHSDWLAATLGGLADDKLVGMRLRWALAEEDWERLSSTLKLLSTEGRNNSAWRYWQARVLEHRGEAEQALEGFKVLAMERGYYSFLSADKLGVPYRFNRQALVADAAALLHQLPVVERIEELHFHQQSMLAHSEWSKTLSDNPDPGVQQQLALLATGRGWHRMAIDAANRAKAWDALDQRFPLPYQKAFQAQAAARQVPGTELMAIARRESAFYPEARSGVGARGLMQLMPATGKQVASSIGVKHSNGKLYEVEHNVLLGSTYYRQLLDRFGGNRVFALGAYNAGPHRIDRWRRKSAKSLPVDIWIETIPFKETREYVQAVLAYNVVFAHLMGDTLALLTPLEQQARY